MAISRQLYGPYAPDQPPFLKDGVADILNVYPAANGYRPVGDFHAITPVVPAAFQGGAAYVSTAGDGTLIVGTATDLYTYSGGVWASVVSSLSLTGARWKFTQFGDIVVCVNGDVIQKVDLLTGTGAALGGSPPTADLCATVRDFVVVGQADGDKQMVQWSAFNNAEGWTPSVDESGFQPMLSGGEIMGLAGGEYGIILQRNRIVRMSYINDPDIVFQFDEISTNYGCISKGSVVQAGNLVFFLSDRGFVYCDGTDIKPIGLERVDRTFFGSYARADLALMYAAVDPRAMTVSWLMPGNPGRMLVYNWGIDKWSPIEIGATGLFSGFTANISLEELDALYPGGLDTIPYSLDDPRFAGGDPLLLLADDTYQIGTLSGDNLAAYFQLPFVEYISGGRARLRNVRPLTDCVSGNELQIDTRKRLGDGRSISTFTTLQNSGVMPVRASERYMSIKHLIAAGSEWTYALGVEAEYEPGGVR